jgi:hypothetical protein
MGCALFHCRAIELNEVGTCLAHAAASASATHKYHSRAIPLNASGLCYSVSPYIVVKSPPEEQQFRY